MKNIATVVFVAGMFSVVAFAAGVRFASSPEPLRIVCESGNEHRENNDDPYLVWTATCSIGSVNGAPVTVEMID